MLSEPLSLGSARHPRISCDSARGEQVVRLVGKRLLIAAGWDVALPTAISAQSLADPAGSEPIGAAARWLEGTLLGAAGIVGGIGSTAGLGR